MRVAEEADAIGRPALVMECTKVAEERQDLETGGLAPALAGLELEEEEVEAVGQSEIRLFLRASLASYTHLFARNG